MMTLRLRPYTKPYTNLSESEFRDRLNEGIREFHRVILPANLNLSFYEHNSDNPLIIHKSEIRGLYAPEMDLSGVDFTNSDLTNAWFKDSNLRGSIFDGTHLEDAYFKGADLEDAHFKHAYLHKANFTEATLRNAIFRGSKRHINAKFTNAIGLETTQFGDAYDLEIKPEELKRLIPMFSPVQ